MSKSLGNGVDPIDVINHYGVDALRYFLTTNSTPGQDMRYSDEKVQSSANYLNKIWNSARYVLSTIPEGFKEVKLDKSNLSNLDKWLLNRLMITINNVTINMDKYDFNAASNHLYNFVYDDFCSQYLEMSKVKLNGSDSLAIDVTRTVLLKALKTIILLIYPYTPFIAEELYQNLQEHLESVMLETYPKVEEIYLDNSADQEIDLLFSMIKEVRNYKITNQLSPSAKLGISISLKMNVSDDFLVFLNRFTFSNVEVKEDLGGLNGELYTFNFGSLIITRGVDKEEIKKKLEKDIEFENSEIARSEKMLSNPNFLAKAPKEKIQIEQEKLELHKNNLKDLLEKLKKL